MRSYLEDSMLQQNHLTVLCFKSGAPQYYQVPFG